MKKENYAGLLKEYMDTKAKLKVLHEKLLTMDRS